MKQLLFISLLLHSLQALTLTKEYTYTAGERDSKASSKKEALKAIKNSVIEEVGTGLVSRFLKTENIHNEATSKELRISVQNFSNTFVQSKLLDERWNGSTYWLKAEVHVDEKGIHKKLKQQFHALQNEALSKKVFVLLKELNTKEQQEALVQTAVKLPFSQKRKHNAHLAILKLFSQYKIYHPTYRKFLLKSLENLPYPSWDVRTYPILSYLSKQAPFSQQEQEVLLNLLSFAEVGSSGLYLEKMLRPNLRVCDVSVESFLTRYLELVKSQKAGLPVFTNLQAEVASLMRLWNKTNLNSSCPSLGLLALTKALEGESLEPKTWLFLLQVLINAYPNHAGLDASFIALLEQGLPKLPPNAKSLKLIKTLYKKSLTKEQERLTALFEENIINIFANTRLYDSDINFAIKQGFIVPKKVFSLELYYNKLLQETPLATKRKLARAIKAYEAKNLDAEHYTKFFELLNTLHQNKDFYNLDVLLPLVQNTKFDKNVTTLLFRASLANNPNLSRKAKKYLLTSSSAKALLEVLPKLSAKEQKRLIIFLSNFGKEAEPALEAVKKRFSNTKDKELLYAISWLEKELKH